MTDKEHLAREWLWLVALTSMCTGVWTSLDSSRQAFASVEFGVMIGIFIAYPAVGLVRLTLWALRAARGQGAIDRQRG